MSIVRSKSLQNIQSYIYNFLIPSNKTIYELDQQFFYFGLIKIRNLITFVSGFLWRASKKTLVFYTRNLCIHMSADLRSSDCNDVFKYIFSNKYNYLREIPSLLFLFWSSKIINDLQIKYIQGVNFLCSI